MIRTFTTAFGVVLAAATTSSAADPKDEVTVGVITTSFKGVSGETVKLLGAPLRSFFARQAGIAGGSVELAKDPQDLAARLSDGRCGLGVFHGYEFAWVKEKHPELEPLVVTVYSTGRPRGCVVVRKDNPATVLADLKAQGVTVPVGTRGHCTLYLAKQRSELPQTTAAPKTPAGTPEEALDAVLAKDAPAALMDVAAFIGYEKLYPGAAQNLRLLCESEHFPQNVIAFSPKHLPAAQAAKLRDALTAAHKVPAGKPLMLLWGITRFDHAPQDYGDHLSTIKRAYPAPQASPSVGNGD